MGNGRPGKPGRVASSVENEKFGSGTPDSGALKRRARASSHWQKRARLASHLSKMLESCRVRQRGVCDGHRRRSCASIFEELKDLRSSMPRGVKPEGDPNVEVANKERRVVTQTRESPSVLPENARQGPQPSSVPRGVNGRLKGDFEKATRARERLWER